MYQLRKIFVRHRVVIGFAAALLVALIAAVGGTTFGLVRARRAEAAARAEAAVAEKTAAVPRIGVPASPTRASPAAAP